MENKFINNHTIFDNAGLEITTNLKSRNILNRNRQFSEYIDLDSIGLLDQPISNYIENVNLFLDKRNLFNFIKYGNAVFFAEKTIENIIMNYPGSLYSTDMLVGLNVSGYNVINIAFNPYSNTTSFHLPTNYIKNPLNVYYLNNTQFQTNNDLKNLTKNYLKYELEVNNQTFEIIEFIAPSVEHNSIISMVVIGNPFNQNGNKKTEVYIKPKSKYINEFLNSLSEIEAYFLETPFRFYNVKTTDDGLTLDYTLKFEFPRSDKYNLDVKSNKYESFYNALISFFKEHDEKYNLLLKDYVPDSLKSLTLEQSNGNENTFGVMNQMFLIWGNEFDKIHQKIRNLKSIESISYQKIDSIPTKYLPSLSKNLGLQINSSQISEDNWRNLLVNISNLWKTKGSRVAIEFLFSFFNIPKEIIEYNQYEYEASKIDYQYLKKIFHTIDSNLTLQSLPVNEDGTVKFNDLVLSQEFLDSLKNLIPVLNSYQIEKEEEKEYYETLYSNKLNLSGDTFSYSLLDKFLDNSICFETTGTTVVDPEPNDILDVCGCPLPIQDKTYKICNTKSNLYIDCSPIILDVIPNINISGETVYVTSETIVNITGSTETSCPIIDYEFELSLISSSFGSGGFVNNATFQVNLNITNGFPITFSDIKLTTSAGIPSYIRRLNDLSFTFNLFYPTAQPNTIFNCDFLIDTEFGCEYKIYLPSPIVLNHNIPPQTEIQTGMLSSLTSIITGGTYTQITVQEETVQSCYYDFNFNVYGGTPPYTYVGLQPNEIKMSGETYSVQVIDASGCTSNIVTGTTLCPVLCENLDFELSYACVSGETYAVLNIDISGGTSPYNTIGANSGDIVEHGNTIVVYVEDATGCKTTSKSITIDCNPTEVECLPILLDVVLETTNVNEEERQSILTYSYQVSALPPSISVDGVSLTAIGIGASNDYLVGSPVVTSFNGDFGAKQYTLDFDPQSPQDVTLQFSITIVLNNGCIYSDVHILSVDAATLSSTQEYNLVLI